MLFIKTMKFTILFFLLFICSLISAHQQADKYDGFETSLLSSDPPSSHYDGFPRFLQKDVSSETENKNDNSGEIISDLESQAQRIVKMRSQAEKENRKMQKNLAFLQNFLQKAKSFCGDALTLCDIGNQGEEKGRSSVRLGEFFAH